MPPNKLTPSFPFFLLLCPLLLQQHLYNSSPGGHHQLLRPTASQHLDAPPPHPNRFNSDPPGLTKRRGWLANKNNLCRLRLIALLCLAQGEKQALRPHFSPLSLFLFHSVPLALSPGRDTKREEKEQETDGERKGDIHITFTQFPVTHLLKRRPFVLILFLCVPVSSSCCPMPEELCFSALTPISPFVVYAHSVLAFTIHPSSPSPPYLL